MVVTDRLALRPVRLGAEIASAISRLHGAQFQLEAAERLFGSKEGLARIRAGDDPATLVTAPGPPPKPAGGCCEPSTCSTAESSDCLAAPWQG